MKTTRLLLLTALCLFLGSVTTVEAQGTPQLTLATMSTVAASATTVTLLESNGYRAGATIYNSGSNNLFVCFSATCTTSAYVVKMVAGAYYELPFRYGGAISGIWDVATGSALISSLQ